jgi:hypothetical protein
MADAPQSPDEDVAISLVRDDALFRAHRAIGLIPKQGLGLGRRTIFYVLLTWLPLAVWAVWKRRAFPGEITEPLLTHYGIHMRLLVALPVLIIGEGLAHRITMLLVPQFLRSGVVPETDAPRFREIIHGVGRLRDSIWPWLVVAVVVATRLMVPQSSSQLHELAWAGDSVPTRWGFGGWWYVYVARPVFQIFLLAWVWRVVLLAVLLRRVSRLNLQLSPLHPDHVGGLGFTERFPQMFAPFAFACSAVLSAHWAHGVIYHGMHVGAFEVVAGFFALVMLLLCLAPMVVFIPKLVRVRRQGVLEYGALAGEHSRLVDRRWIRHKDVGEPRLLEAPELGPVADVGTLFQAVKQMRTIPVGKRTVMGVALPIIVPLLALFSIEIPIVEMLEKIVKGLL